MEMERVAILSAGRTPIGAYMGALREVPVYELAAQVLNEVVKRAGIKPEQVDDVILGSCYMNGESVNPARMALLSAGWPLTVTGVSIDRRCASSLEAMSIAGMKIQTHNSDIIVAGGAENMSQGEFYIPGNVKWNVGGAGDAPRGHGSLALTGMIMYDRIQRGRVMSQPIHRFGVLPSMMAWGDLAAETEHITRQQCDEWALKAHQKAVAAMDSGKFKEEIIAIKVPQRKGDPIVVDKDETPRRDTSIEQLSKLKSVLGGVSTAGNSSAENDGASAVVMTSASFAKANGLKPMAYLRSFAVGGADPRRTWEAVPIAVNRALKIAGLTINQMDLIEIQEAFAGQALADIKELGISWEDADKRVNVNGSGISLGHPVGATGTMRMTTLLHEMKRRNAKYGLETICGGGGLGICAIVERD